MQCPLLIQQADFIDVLDLGPAGIRLDGFPIEAVEDLLAVELGGALKRHLDRVAARF